MRITIIIIIGSILLYSCTKRDGKGRSVNPSSISLEFSREGGVQHITTESDEWIISDLEENGNVVYSWANGSIDDEKITIRDTIFTEGSMTQFVGRETPVEIEGEWYTLKRDLQKVTFKLYENLTNKERKFIITLFGFENYWDYVTITQLPSE